MVTLKAATFLYILVHARTRLCLPLPMLEMSVRMPVKTINFLFFWYFFKKTQKFDYIV